MSTLWVQDNEWNVIQDTLVVAVSGGVDSMVLLDMLYEAQAPIVAVVHIQHGLRTDAEEDAQLVEEFCKIRGLHFVCEYLIPPSSGNIENWARTARYACLTRVQKETQADWIVTAHHQGDQTETVLLHMSRGAGLSGLQGMRVVQGNILRPLLYTTKEELYSYARTHGILYREDSTNSTSLYQRNVLRNQVLPAWRTLYPTLDTQIQRLSRQAQAWEEYHQELLTLHPCWKQWQQKESWDRQQWNAMHIVAKYTFLRTLYRYVYGHAQDIYEAHLEEVNNWIATGTSGSMKFLGGDICLQLSATEVSRVYQQEILPEIQLSEQVVTQWGTWTCCITPLSHKPEQLHTEGIYVALQESPVWTLRSWREGDRFRPLGMSGQQKLSDYFINTKVPKHKRAQIPVLLAGDRIVCVGDRLDEWYRIRDEEACYYHIHCYEHSD